MKPRKKDNYNDDDIDIARFARALGHPARIAIIRHLASMSTCFFKEISEDLPIAPSTVCQHMSELKNAGLILGRVEPPKVKYCINKKNWKKARASMEDLLRMKIAKR